MPEQPFILGGKVGDQNFGMRTLRAIFPSGEADEMNICLFSTSGIHGHHGTIEQAARGEVDYVTFLVIHPRAVSMVYGNVYARCSADYDFLRRLRASSHKVIAQIGLPSRRNP